MQFEKKLVAVMNENKDIGAIMNSLAHICFGLGASVRDKNDCRLTNYKDAGGNDHKHVSEIPFIILKAGSNKIQNLRNAAIVGNIQYVDFTNTMTIGTYQEQIQKSAITKDEDMDYYGIVLFGDWNKVTELTKKFSLWK